MQKGFQTCRKREDVSSSVAAQPKTLVLPMEELPLTLFSTYRIVEVMIKPH
jgi:hypothetical protein